MFFTACEMFHRKVLGLETMSGADIAMFRLEKEETPNNIVATFTLEK